MNHVTRCVIVDFGMGNLLSLKHKLSKIKLDISIGSRAADLEPADVLILPGIGHFAQAMKNLADRGLIDVLNKKVLTDKTPILGICIGMQLFSRQSEEGDAPGLGWLDAETVRFRFEDPGLKIPHINWATIHPANPSPLLDGLPADQRFYFIHSYHMICNRAADVLTTSWYGREFVSSVHCGNIFGVQFHPEKSHKAGMDIVRNFLRWSGSVTR